MNTPALAIVWAMPVFFALIALVLSLARWSAASAAALGRRAGFAARAA